MKERTQGMVRREVGGRTKGEAAMLKLGCRVLGERMGSSFN